MRYGKPKVAGYAVLYEGMLGVIGDGGVQEIEYDAIEKEDRRRRKTLQGTGGWIGFTDKYWATTVIPDQQAPIEERFSSTGTTVKNYQTDVLDDGANDRAGRRHAIDGPAVRRRQGDPDDRQLPATLGIRKFDLLIDWGWFYFITKPMFRLIDFIYHLIGNFGVAILIVTVLRQGRCSSRSPTRAIVSMAKMKMVAAADRGASRSAIPTTRRSSSRRSMALYKREKINPVSGCLPMLIQIPVFFALYKVLFVTIEMRQAPFFGWIKDLSAPDPTNIFNLFGLLPFDPTQLPIIGHFLALGIWPLIMGVSHVRADEDQSGAARSDAEADVQLDAGDLHLHARRLSRRAWSSTGPGATRSRSSSRR